MPRVALKIAYDGTAFHGQARQPDFPTVEGDILLALRNAGILQDPRAGHFQSASRTDRGVSALGNVVAFQTHLDADVAGRAFNAKSRRVWTWATASVPDDFNARRALRRWYRYTLGPDHEVERLGQALGLFEGEHDFRNFTRDRTRTVARIDSATATRSSDAVLIDVRAPSFRWNLVRRIVAAALRFEAHRTTLAELARSLQGGTRADFGLAAAEPLTLMDVEYGFPFVPLRDPTTAERVRSLRDARCRALRFADELSSCLEAPPRNP